VGKFGVEKEEKEVKCLAFRMQKTRIEKRKKSEIKRKKNEKKSAVWSYANPHAKREEQQS